MSRAIIDNQAEFPKTQTRRMVRWVLRELDVDLPSLVVRVLRSPYGVHYGRFYPDARYEHPRVWARNNGIAIPVRPEQHLIVAQAAENPSGVHDRQMRGGPPPIDPRDWIESLLCITAHEATHVRQFLFPKPKAPRWSEVECEWSEYRLLKRFRERRNA